MPCDIARVCVVCILTTDTWIMVPQQSCRIDYMYDIDIKILFIFKFYSFTWNSAASLPVLLEGMCIVSYTHNI